MTQFLPLLSQAVPAGIAYAGLKKLDPRMQKFLTTATAAGYATDQIISFLRNKMVPDAQKADQAQIQQREAQGTARPDELASAQTSRAAAAPFDMLQGLLSGGAAAAGGAAAYNQEDQAQNQVAEEGKETARIDQLKQAKGRRGLREELQDQFTAGYGSGENQYLAKVMQHISNNKFPELKGDQFAQLAKNYYDNGQIKTIPQLKSLFDQVQQQQGGQQQAQQPQQQQGGQPQQGEQQPGPGAQRLMSLIQSLRASRGG